jgi:hypothetical protein
MYLINNSYSTYQSAKAHFYYTIAHKSRYEPWSRIQRGSTHTAVLHPATKLLATIFIFLVLGAFSMVAAGNNLPEGNQTPRVMISSAPLPAIQKLPPPRQGR